MTGSRGVVIAGRKVSRGFSGRPIPKRGQVKVAIVVGLAQSFASIFSPATTRRASHHFS